MLREIAKIFETEYNDKSREDDKDYMISVNHIPEDGDYVLLEGYEGGYKEFERIKIKKDRKTKKVVTVNPYFDFIRSADYMSRYLESNKAIKDKNIHSNNYLTFFIKKENIFFRILKNYLFIVVLTVLFFPTYFISNRRSNRFSSFRFVVA